MADRIGIRISTLADWEDGRTSTLPASALVRAVSYLGATVDDLDRITSASSDHEVIGQQLAEARISGAAQVRTNTRPDNVHLSPPIVWCRAVVWRLKDWCMRS